ncbi:MAG: sulfite exporter TauE/SafE family protein [Piscinibacter sp.]|nr:sulfite exporter TauE/SafE family protein [Piscinibacter sp.]
MGAAVIALLLVAGLAVGATSIGGVLVVPVLTSGAGSAPSHAVAASSFAFAFSGLAAFATAAREPSAGAGRAGWPLHGGALLGAALGALTLAWLPAGAVRTGVGLLAVASGLYALLGRRAPRDDPAGAPARGTLAALGLAVGCGSAWSGTGGPVLLLPLVTLAGWPAGEAVAAAQRIQLPVALAATAVHLAAGRLDLMLGATVGVLVLAGWAAGRALARRLPMERLRQAVALALIATGLWYL